MRDCLCLNASVGLESPQRKAKKERMCREKERMTHRERINENKPLASLVPATSYLVEYVEIALVLILANYT